MLGSFQPDDVTSFRIVDFHWSARAPIDRCVAGVGASDRLRDQGAAEAAAGGETRGDAGAFSGASTERTRTGTGSAASGRALARTAIVSGFDYIGGALCVDGVPLADIARRFGTPCYVYSRALLEQSYRTFDTALADVPHLVCYALKANSNLAVLNLFARLGSGFDIVSGGELARVIAARGDPSKVVFSGVGKTEQEMTAALDAGILCFNVESASELAALARAAAHVGRRAPVSFRVNPHVDPGTHPYIATGLADSKFGIPFDQARDLYERAARLESIAVRGIDLHIGSQITALAPYREAIAKALELADALRAAGIELQHIDVGGGLGIRYRDEQPVSVEAYADMLRALFAGRREQLIVEPGRRLVGPAGVLLTRVLFLKPGAEHSFAIVDGAMNDLLRPALYAAWHPVWPVLDAQSGERRLWQIVGPVCESGDFLAEDRELALAEGDLLAIGAAGAYGFVMSSNYNSRPRVAEVMVSEGNAIEVRARETVASLYAGESILP